MPVLNYLPSALLILAVACLATENLSHYPIGILSLLGIYQLVRRGKHFIDTNEAKLLISLFGCIWVPMLLSLPDAVNSARSAKTVFAYLHYLPAGLYVIYALRDTVLQRIVLAGIAFIVGFWCVDGILQLISGKNLLGYPYDGSVLKGMFHPKQRFGLILAVFAPVYIHVVHRLAARSAWAWLLMIPFLVAITFSLKRTAWMMFIVAVGLYVMCFFRYSRARIHLVLAMATVIAIALSASFALSPNLRLQATGTLAVFSKDFETADVATSHRLSLWRTGLRMASEHWINGVGPRGYRAAYREYAPPDDFWIARGTKGQTHPHLMVLEVLVETGAIGLLGYALVVWLLVRQLWRRRYAGFSAPYLMVAIVAWFPLNAHLAFYGSYWSNIAWLMIALGCVATEQRET